MIARGREDLELPQQLPPLADGSGLPADLGLLGQRQRGATEIGLGR